MKATKRPRKKSIKQRIKSLKRLAFIQVGKTKVKDKRTGLPIACRYSDVPTDDQGWVTDLRYIPIYFDMLVVKIRDKPRAVSAWFDGKSWIGLRMRPGNVVVAWKRNPYD